MDPGLALEFRAAQEGLADEQVGEIPRDAVFHGGVREGFHHEVHEGRTAAGNGAADAHEAGGKRIDLAERSKELLCGRQIIFIERVCLLKEEDAFPDPGGRVRHDELDRLRGPENILILCQIPAERDGEQDLAGQQRRDLRENGLHLIRLAGHQDPVGGLNQRRRRARRLKADPRGVCLQLLLMRRIGEDVFRLQHAGFDPALAERLPHISHPDKSEFHQFSILSCVQPKRNRPLLA